MEEKAEQAKQQKQNNNLLLLACTRGYCADAQHLVQTGADIAARDKVRVSTVHFAAAHGHLDVLSFLWSKGAELDWETPDGSSPLHLAALKGHSDVVQFLLSKKAWADAQDAQDNTALHLAARGKSAQTVSELLKVSASTTITNKLGLTPLAEALVSGRQEIAQLLLGKDAKGLKHKPKGWSLLHLAAGTGQTSSVQLLLKQRADVQEEGVSGATPLHAAAMSGSVACVKLLLDAKASTSAASHDGRLPSDLVPQDHPDRAQLLALLKPSSSSIIQKKRTADSLAGSGAESGSQASGPPQVQAFKALSKQSQLSRVDRWAQSGPEDPQVRGELKGFWSEVKKRLADAHKTMMVLALHRVLMMLHEDEDYQRDVGDPDAMDAILNDVKQHPEKLQKYNTDPAKQNVFKKMELFTMVLKATDQRGKVPWQETLVPTGNLNWKEQDETRKKGLESMLETKKEAAIAAALAGSEEDAAKMADAAEAESRRRLTQSQQPSSYTTAKPSSNTTPATASSSTNSGSGATTADASSAGRSRESSSSAQKPPTGLKSRKAQQSKGLGATKQEAVRSKKESQAFAEDDDMPEPMTWKEALLHLRFQIAGYAILLLGFWAWLLWIDYNRVSESDTSAAALNGQSN